MSSEETVLDIGRIHVLRQSLGDQRCREVVAEVVFHLTDRMTLLDAARAAGNHADARALASRVASLGEQVGLSDFARVARDLGACLGAGDEIATAAVATRLTRLAEESLCGVMRHAGSMTG